MALKLRHMKKPKSVVAGDIDQRLVNKYADIIAIPVHTVFKKVYRSQEWPQLWASETVTLIPKSANPSDFSEIRNISCMPLFSKCLENFVLEDLKKSVTLSRSQFGGIKGQGVDHFLVDTWNDILTGLEDTRACMSLMSIDFRKAFNTMCHSNCLSALFKLGANNEQVSLVAAFLRNRLMRVKVADSLSAPRLVSGGAPRAACSAAFCSAPLQTHWERI